MRKTKNNIQNAKSFTFIFSYRIFVSRLIVRNAFIIGQPIDSRREHNGGKRKRERNVCKIHLNNFRNICKSALCIHSKCLQLCI